MPAKPRSRKGDFEIPKLAALLPGELGGWTQETLGQPIATVETGPVPALQATYVKGGQTAIVSLTTNMPIAAAKGSRAIQQQRVEPRGQNVATLPLSNGLSITASSYLAEGPALVRLIEAIDLDGAEKLVRAAR